MALHGNLLAVGERWSRLGGTVRRAACGKERCLPSSSPNQAAIPAFALLTPPVHCQTFYASTPHSGAVIMARSHHRLGLAACAALALIANACDTGSALTFEGPLPPIGSLGPPSDSGPPAPPPGQQLLLARSAVDAQPGLRRDQYRCASARSPRQARGRSTGQRPCAPQLRGQLGELPRRRHGWVQPCQVEAEGRSVSRIRPLVLHRRRDPVMPSSPSPTSAPASCSGTTQTTSPAPTYRAPWAS